MQYKNYERYKSLAYVCKGLHPIVVCSSPYVCNLSPIYCPRGFVVDASLHFYVFQIIAYPSHVGIFLATNKPFSSLLPDCPRIRFAIYI